MACADNNIQDVDGNCDECGESLRNMHIYIMTHRVDDEEITICQGCRHHYGWVDWRDDQEDDISEC